MRYFQAAAGLFPLLAQLTNALVVIDSSLASSCVYYMATFEWGCNSHSTGHSAYACRCASVEWLGSVTTCIVSENNSTHLKDHAMRHIAGRCLAKGGFDYSIDELYGYYENASAYLEWPTEEDINNKLYHPIRTNTSEWEYYHKSFKDFTFEVQKSQWFGWGLVFYWGGVMLVATLLNINDKYIGLNFNTNFIKRHLSLPSTFSGIKNNEQLYYLFKFIPLEFPTRIETVIIAFFIVQTFISSGVGYTLSLPNAFINDRWYMNLDLISYRTDMMAISLFPIIYLFGIRNNPFIPLTGMSFSSFAIYHKWVATVMVCLAFVHSIIWTVDAIKDGGYAVWFVDAYFQYGVAATTISVLLVFQAEKWVRDLAYEVFLVFHKLFNIFFIVCMYYHCNTLGWLGWIWSMAGILVFDRVIRWIRIGLSGGLQKTKIIRCDGDVIKLILNKPKLVKYSAGSHAFIYFMSPWYYGWQSHPFTVISSPLEDDKNKLIVYFKPKKGITKTLLKKLAKQENQEMTIRVLVEGPYGNPVNFVKAQSKQSRFVGIAGGLGIASVFPTFAHLLDKATPVTTQKVKAEGFPKSSDTGSSTALSASSEAFSTFSTVETDHKIYWVINNLGNVIWFNKELDWLIKRGCSIEILYTGSKDAEKESFSDLHQLLETLHVKVTYTSRPKMETLVAAEFLKSSASGQDLELSACGPASFNDDLRYGVVQTLKANKSSPVHINYHVESYTW